MDGQNIPSKSLLEFYRLKLKEWRSRHADLELILADLKKLVSYNREREEETLKVLKNNSELHDTISDLQLCLYKEREHVLRLTAENDQLRIDKANDKRNIQFLLLQCGMKESELYGKHTKSMIKKKKVSFQELRDFNHKLKEFHETEQDILRLKIKSLEAELKEQTENLRDEVLTLVNDLDLRKKEWQMERKILEQQISCLNCRLYDCQMKKLYEIDNILEKLENEREKEVKIIEENNQLKKSIKLCKELLGDDFPENTNKLLKKDEEILNLKTELHRNNHIIRNYEALKLEFEKRISELNEELNDLKEINCKLKERFNNKEEYLNKKLEDERIRRLREGEGFRNDIKLLRSKLQSIERQIKLDKLRKREQ